MLFAEDVIQGDRHAKENMFQWNKVVMNLPGDTMYDPTLPWVYKE
jgi:hypothetical protein